MILGNKRAAARADLPSRKSLFVFTRRRPIEVWINTDALEADEHSGSTMEPRRALTRGHL